jgi:16S rRNA (cytosine1402-N4)-methyltransferase
MCCWPIWDCRRCRSLTLRVKKAFKNGLRDGRYASISDDVIRPSAEEQRANPRSSAAKLRWAIRAAADAG